MGEGLDRCFPSGKLPRWGETGVRCARVPSRKVGWGSECECWPQSKLQPWGRSGVCPLHLSLSFPGRRDRILKKLLLKVNTSRGERVGPRGIQGCMVVYAWMEWVVSPQRLGTLAVSPTGNCLWPQGRDSIQVMASPKRKLAGGDRVVIGVLG